MADIALPRLMKVGAGTRRELGALFAALGLSRPLIVTDRFLESTGRVAEIVGILAAAGVQARVFAEAVPDPTLASIDAALAHLNRGVHDSVLGFGGGSPIDTAKAVAVLAVHGGPMPRFKAPHQQNAPGLPVIAVPTTAGTGSEATRFTIVTDENTDEKMLCAGLAYLPVAAVVDYELTLSKPRRLTADTGIDSLTHAIEAYVSRKANAMADAFAVQAMGLIARHIRTACDQPDDRPAREAMMLGATLAGMAFSNSSVALVHGMSRPIGAHFHVAHGLSNAMLLPLVTGWSAPAAEARYATCARAMGLADERAGDALAVGRLTAELEALNADLGVPGPRAYGIEEARWTQLLPLMAEQALASGSPANNPRAATLDDIVELYRMAWAQ